MLQHKSCLLNMDVTLVCHFSPLKSAVFRVISSDQTRLLQSHSRHHDTDTRLDINSLTSVYRRRRRRETRAYIFIYDAALRLMCPVCLAVITVSRAPAGAAGLWLKQPQPGCSPDSPGPQGSSPVTHRKGRHLLRMPFISIHQKREGSARLWLSKHCRLFCLVKI